MQFEPQRATTKDEHSTEAVYLSNSSGNHFPTVRKKNTFRSKPNQALSIIAFYKHNNQSLCCRFFSYFFSLFEARIANAIPAPNDEKNNYFYEQIYMVKM